MNSSHNKPKARYFGGGDVTGGAPAKPAPVAAKPAPVAAKPMPKPMPKPVAAAPRPAPRPVARPAPRPVAKTKPSKAKPSKAAEAVRRGVNSASGQVMKPVARDGFSSIRGGAAVGSPNRTPQSRILDNMRGRGGGQRGGGNNTGSMGGGRSGC